MRTNFGAPGIKVRTKILSDGQPGIPDHLPWTRRRKHWYQSWDYDGKWTKSRGRPVPTRRTRWGSQLANDRHRVQRYEGGQHADLRQDLGRYSANKQSRVLHMWREFQISVIKSAAGQSRWTRKSTTRSSTLRPISRTGKASRPRNRGCPLPGKCSRIRVRSAIMGSEN